jgi:hypothetical protein
MRQQFRDHAPLLLIAVALGWSITALAFGRLADAHWGSVLLPFFERVLMLLAIAAALIAIVILLWRTAPRRSSLRTHVLRCAPGAFGLVATTAWAAYAPLDLRVGVAALGAAVGMLFTFDARPPGSDRTGRL